MTFVTVFCAGKKNPEPKFRIKTSQELYNEETVKPVYQDDLIRPEM